MEERKGYGKSLKQCREGVWMSGGVKFRPISTANCACVEKGAQSPLRKQRTAARKRQSDDCRDDHHRRVTISVVLSLFLYIAEVVIISYSIFLLVPIPIIFSIKSINFAYLYTQYAERFFFCKHTAKFLNSRN